MTTNGDISIGMLMWAYRLEFLEGKRLLFELKGSYSKNIEAANGRECNEAVAEAIAGELVNEVLVVAPYPPTIEGSGYIHPAIPWGGYSS